MNETDGEILFTSVYDRVASPTGSSIDAGITTANVTTSSLGDFIMNDTITSLIYNPMITTTQIAPTRDRYVCEVKIVFVQILLDEELPDLVGFVQKLVTHP